MEFNKPRYSLTYLKYDIKYFLNNIKYYLKFRFSSVKKRNVLYFVFEPDKTHPGLADRMKAIVSLYNIAKKNRYKLKIYFETPFCLNEYLKPKKDWLLDLSELEYSLYDTKILNECNWHRIGKLKENKQYHCYNYAGNDMPWQFTDSGYKWADLYNELFEPSEKLRESIEELHIIDKPYIAVQLRFVNALERFENTFFDNYLETQEQRDALIKKCKDGIKAIIDENPKTPVYIFSDSKVFLDSLNDLDVIVLNHDSLAHSGNDTNVDGQMKTFIDLLVMSHADKIYRIRAKELYNLSCFALLAARMGDVIFIDRDLN